MRDHPLDREDVDLPQVVVEHDGHASLSPVQSGVAPGGVSAGAAGGLLRRLGARRASIAAITSSVMLSAWSAISTLDSSKIACAPRSVHHADQDRADVSVELSAALVKFGGERAGAGVLLAARRDDAGVEVVGELAEGGGIGAGALLGQPLLLGLEGGLDLARLGRAGGRAAASSSASSALPRADPVRMRSWLSTRNSGPRRRSCAAAARGRQRQGADRPHVPDRRIASEARGDGEAEVLGLVVVLLAQGAREVEPQRREGRLDEQADADGRRAGRSRRRPRPCCRRCRRGPRASRCRRRRRR